ncbi:MAG: Cna B-type domain-containing protein [Clostridiaceae bacterium]
MFKLFKKLTIIALFISMMTAVSLEVNAATYLSTGSNYYDDSVTMDRGFLDQVIPAPAATHLLNSAGKGLLTYTVGMTYNQFYEANNISPEDNYSQYYGPYYYPKPYDTTRINSTPPPGRFGYDLTYAGPVSDQQRVVAAANSPYAIFSNTLFSRLTVGNLAPVSSQNTNYVFGNFGEYASSHLFPNMIGYGENGTVNDYMLTPQNDVVIPARYNTLRNDVWLTMRSGTVYGLRGAQAFLQALSNGTQVMGSVGNPKFYLDTQTEVMITPYGYNNLGTLGKFNYPSASRAVKTSMTKVPINEFGSTLSSHLRTLENNSGVNDIAAGNGGQVRITGFYRDSQIDTNYLIDEGSRLTDSVNTVDVAYFIYTNRDTISGAETAGFPNVPAKYASQLTMQGNILKLLSPNASEYKIEMTRPYFTAYGDLTTVKEYSPATFDSVLGASSFTVLDNGINPDGSEVGVDVDRVRVRVSYDGGTTYDLPSYTITELEDLLSTGKLLGNITLAYTYSAIDSDGVGTQNIVGLLPGEINDNSGAYAVPIVRKLVIYAKNQVNHEYYTRNNGVINTTPDTVTTGAEVNSVDDTTNTDPLTFNATEISSPYYFSEKVYKQVFDLDSDGNVIPGQTVAKVEVDKSVIDSPIDYEAGKLVVITIEYVKDIFDITGTKTWDDANNQDGIRPKEITITLTGGPTLDPAYTNNPIDEVISDTSGDTQSYTFEGLYMYEPVLDADGNKTLIEYLISENEILPYSPTYEGYNITNTYIPKTMNIEVTKIWDDANNQDGKRPASITVKLLANKVEVDSAVIVPDANGVWKATFENKPVNSSGIIIDYTVEEVKTPEYDPTTVINGSNYEITNTYIPEKMNLSGKKIWDDGNNLDGIRPATVVVNLLADGTNVEERIVSAYTNWGFTFESIDRFSNGKEIIYTVTENPVAQYTTSIVGFNITNKYVPKPRYTTEWVAQDGTILKPLVTDIATQDPLTFDGYTFVETVTTATGVKHIYSKDPIPVKITTEWVAQDGTVLKPMVTLDIAQEPLTFDGYTFVETVKTATGVKHVYSKNQVPASITTEWVAEDGTVLKPMVTGETAQDPLAFDGYTFVETVKTATGVKHVYSKNPIAAVVTTEWVAEDGTVLRDMETSNTALPVQDFVGYEFDKTEDTSTGVKHIYRKIVEPVMVTTEWESEDGTVLKDKVSSSKALPADAIEGYEFVKTIDTATGVKHIYRKLKPVVQVTTEWVTEDGTVLKDKVTGTSTLPKEDFKGYEFVKTVETATGVKHIYKKIADPLPDTGSENTALTRTLKITGTFLLISGVALFFFKKKKQYTE